MKKTIKFAGHEISVKPQEEKKKSLSKDEVSSMLAAFKAYRESKEKEDRNIIENEGWFKGDHWKYISGSDKNAQSFRPAGSYLLNGIWHRHAEAMDNFPQP